jgi:hypothetical protein
MYVTLCCKQFVPMPINILLTIIQSQSFINVSVNLLVSWEFSYKIKNAEACIIVMDCIQTRYREPLSNFYTLTVVRIFFLIVNE